MDPSLQDQTVATLECPKRATPATAAAHGAPDAAQAAQRAADALFSLQRPDGHWCAELEGDSILESEYMLMKFILGQEREPMVDGRDGWQVMQELAAALREQQRDDGGWGQYPGSAADVSSCVKAWVCLRLMGDDERAPHMQRAAAMVLARGGAEACNSFTNFYLAALGLIPWMAVPAIPPEVVWLPRWFPFHLSKVSAWSRTMILPLAIVSTLRPTRRVRLALDPITRERGALRRLTMRREVPAAWRAFFRAIDLGLKGVGALIGTAPRRPAIRDAFDWIMQRASQDGPARTEGVGAIFPPMVYLQIVFKALGMPRSDARVQVAERDLDAFFLRDARGTRLQPCFSPVWDTGIGLYALTDAGFDANDPRVAKACAWLESQEVTHVGDWAVHCAPGTGAGGWCFEYANAWYPDCDDTAMVAMALHRARRGSSGAGDRGVRWMLAMQNDDGGWAAFDRTEHRQWMEYVPFADHNAMQDPSCPDITGRVLECLSWHGLRCGDAAIDRAIRYIQSHQLPQGCFFGRWGVNYIYGTWQAVIGPIRCGEPREAGWIRRAGAWMKSVQKPDGSFGESADTYEDPSLMGTGPSTASQTAWGAMVLQEIYGPDDPDLARAIAWLARTQLTSAQAADPAANPDGDPAGSWCETELTGTGFPKVFYLRYHMYRLYFPLMALGRFARAHGAA
jgi:squalene-hopene/tetraprenyl-beta-curcumene cyclase